MKKHTKNLWADVFMFDMYTKEELVDKLYEIASSYLSEAGSKYFYETNDFDHTLRELQHTPHIGEVFKLADSLVLVTYVDNLKDKRYKAIPAVIEYKEDVDTSTGDIILGKIFKIKQIKNNITATVIYGGKILDINIDYGEYDNMLILNSSCTRHEQEKYERKLKLEKAKNKVAKIIEETGDSKELLEYLKEVAEK
jgi:hypothetical protein